MNKIVKTLLAILVILAILFVAYLAFGLVNKTYLLTVQLTDPAHLPSGTESLSINYSSLAVHVLNASGSQWIGAKAGGDLNLLGLANFSTVISTIRIPFGSFVDMARLNVTSARIKVYNVSYPLSISNREMLASVSGAGENNQSASLLLDLSPTVTPVFSSNSSSFAMITSMKGVIVNGTSITQNINSTARINSSVMKKISFAGPDITITSASLAASGNTTQVSVKVRDNSNSSVVVRGILVIGNETVSVSPIVGVKNAEPSFDNLTVTSLINSTFSIVANAIGQLTSQSGKLKGQILANISVGELLNLSSRLGGSVQTKGLATGSFLNSTLSGIGNTLQGINVSEKASILRNLIGNLSNSTYANSLSSANITQLENDLQGKLSIANLSKANLTAILNLLTKANNDLQAQYAKNVSIEQSRLSALAFIAEDNATLSVPSSLSQLSSTSYGYLIEPGQNATFTFNGQVALAGGKVSVSLINNARYKIEVIGDQGAFASYNLTAG